MDPVRREPTLDCTEVRRSLWEYLDGRVCAERLGAFNIHLAGCPSCRGQVEFAVRLLRNLWDLRRPHAEPLRLRKAVLGVLRAAGMNSARQ